MKVTVEVDCTPDEARRFMGLPDVDKVNSVYMDAMTRAMQGVTSFEQLEAYTRQMAPMGQVGLKLFQNLMESARTFSREDDAGKSGE
jgi:hypothetical protein